MTDLEKLKDFIMTAQIAAEQGECLMPNVNDVLNEIERLQALSIANVVGQSEQLIAFSKWKEEKGYNPIYDHKGLVEEYLKSN